MIDLCTSVFFSKYLLINYTNTKRHKSIHMYSVGFMVLLLFTKKSL